MQRTSAKKSEKIDFLEEHVQTLVAELQRKSRLLQSYVLREQAGTLSSNKMDDNKVSIFFYLLNFKKSFALIVIFVHFIAN